MFRVNDEVEAFDGVETYKGTVSLVLPDRLIIFVPAYNQELPFHPSDVKFDPSKYGNFNATYTDNNGNPVHGDIGARIVYQNYKLLILNYIGFLIELDKYLEVPTSGSTFTLAVWGAVRNKEFVSSDFKPDLVGFRNWLWACRPNEYTAFMRETGYNSELLSGMVYDLFMDKSTK